MLAEIILNTEHVATTTCLEAIVVIILKNVLFLSAVGISCEKNFFVLPRTQLKLIVRIRVQHRNSSRALRCDGSKKHENLLSVKQVTHRAT